MADEAIDLVDRVARAIDDAARREDETDRRVECLLHVRTDPVLLASTAYGLLALVERDATRRERERCAEVNRETARAEEGCALRCDAEEGLVSDLAPRCRAAAQALRAAADRMEASDE